MQPLEQQCTVRRIGTQQADGTAAAAGRDFLRLDCLRDNPGIRAYYGRLGFEHRGDLVVNGRGMSIYERHVHAQRN